MTSRILDRELREEYCQLIYRIGKRYRNPHLSGHKGIREVAERLGISYHTLRGRLKGYSKSITSEQLLAARYLYDNPALAAGEGAVSDRIPEPPRIPGSMSEHIAAILHDSSRPLNVDEILFSLNTYLGMDTTRRTVQNRLSEMILEDVPLVRKLSRGMYISSDYNAGENC